jgi:short-subunit dehydrogenase
MSAAEVARNGFDAMMDGRLEVVAGVANKLRAAMTRVVPDSTLAQMHRDTAAPGTGKSETPKSKKTRTDRPRA